MKLSIFSSMDTEKIKNNYTQNYQKYSQLKIYWQLDQKLNLTKV
jgi:hypothetical protein